jgi:hypothetical protein
MWEEGRMKEKQEGRKEGRKEEKEVRKKREVGGKEEVIAMAEENLYYIE